MFSFAFEFCVAGPPFARGGAQRRPGQKGTLFCGGPGGHERRLFSKGGLCAARPPAGAVRARTPFVRRALEAPPPHEPVIPTEANQTICVVGASGFGRPIAAAAHRPERYALLAGVPEAAEATPEAEARVLRSEDLHTKVYVNQVETLWNLADARVLARLMDCPVLAGSLWRREYFPCW